MMRRFLPLFILAALPACAMGDTGCSGLLFSGVRSLVDLSQEIVAILSEKGRNRIADSNEQFQLTDVVDTGNLPFRRFSLAAINADYIFAAVEHGGRGYSVELWRFTRGKNGWYGERLKEVFDLPRTTQELVARMCK
jgi:hypothetical protein